MKKLIIVGASGHGKVVADIASKMNQWESIFFLDDDSTRKTCLGIEVVGTTKDSIQYKNEADFFIAIGNNKIREKVHNQLVEDGFSLAALIHPNSVIGIDVEIDKGTVIMAGAIINSSTKIGKGCIINTGVTVDHDNDVGNFVHISPGANLAGNVKIGNRCWLGLGANVINNILICSGCTIGAGALVLSDINSSGTYVGIPAQHVAEERFF